MTGADRSIDLPPDRLAQALGAAVGALPHRGLAMCRSEAKLERGGDVVDVLSAVGPDGA
jgi:hypothetical protein